MKVRMTTGEAKIYVLRILRVTAPTHTLTAISDTTILRFHIAILNRHDKDDQKHQFQGMAYTRRTIMEEANAQLAYGNA